MKLEQRFMAVALLTALLVSGTSYWLPADQLHAAPAQAQTAIVNINKANAEEMQTVRGIGPKLAERIVKYREEKGKFQKVEDLMQVNGIGEAKLEKIKSHITV